MQVPPDELVSVVTETNTAESSIAAPPLYDLVVVGGGAAGLSVAISSQRSGLSLVRIVDRGSSVAFPDLVSENQLDVGYGETVTSVEKVGDALVLSTNRLSYRTKAVLIAERNPTPSWEPPVAPEVAGRISVDVVPDSVRDADVLVVGHSDHAVELMARAVEAGGRVVLAAGGMDPARLSPAADHMLRRIERERRGTILYRSVPERVGAVDGLPMAFFDDRRTPDLQFDEVIFAGPRTTPDPASFSISADALASEAVWFVGDDSKDAPSDLATARPGWEVGSELAKTVFPELGDVMSESKTNRLSRHTGAIDELREEHYNATITKFEPTHSDLWVLRVRPDRPGSAHMPGQYASLGLGFWEPRIDEAGDPEAEKRWEKLIRRSYSISSRMFDDDGYLALDNEGDELEFYIVLVKPTPDNVPALTPRLALKRPGDRIYLGPKVAGRYTLASVRNPEGAVVLLSTGTGEAPHNGMVVELLSRGHTGPIVSAVSVRQWADLGYMEKNQRLAERFPNYTYIPLPTRESDVPKRYIQDVISDGTITEAVGGSLDPESAHIFLCGNPSMIGLPEAGDDGEMVFPETTGAVEILSGLGFVRDHREQPGTLHVEEYW